MGEDKMLEELKQYTLTTYDEWIRQLRVLSERAGPRDRALAGAYYLRSAGFSCRSLLMTRAARRVSVSWTRCLLGGGVTPDQHYAVAVRRYHVIGLPVHPGFTAQCLGGVRWLRQLHRGMDADVDDAA